MIAVTVVRISGAKLVVARKKPNSTQITPCQALSPAYRCRSHTTTASTRTSESEMTKCVSPPPEVSRVPAGRDDRAEAAGGPAELSQNAGLDLIREGSIGPGGQVL